MLRCVAGSWCSRSLCFTLSIWHFYFVWFDGKKSPEYDCLTRGFFARSMNPGVSTTPTVSSLALPSHSSRDRFSSLRRSTADIALCMAQATHTEEQGVIQMAIEKPITDRIFECLQGAEECEFEALVARYPQFTWNELFQEVSRLNRTGQVTITRNVGVFTIRQTPAMK